jgi:hypothetical protein
MTYESLVNESLVNRDGQSVVDRRGGAEAREIRARNTKAFRPARVTRIRAGSVARYPAQLPLRERPEIDCGMGSLDRAWRYF